MRVSTDQHVYVCRSLQINIATYPLTRIISVVILVSGRSGPSRSGPKL